MDIKTKKGRILVENIGQMTYYSPQIELKFFFGFKKYWQSIYPAICSGKVLYTENRCRYESDAKQYFLDYTKLTNIQIIF